MGGRQPSPTPTRNCLGCSGEEVVATVMLPPVWNLGQTARADHKATTTTDVAAAATLLAASSHLAAGGGGRQALTQPRPRPRRWRTPRTSSSTSGALTPPSRGRSTKTL